MASLMFQGDGLALSSDGLNVVASRAGLQATEIWTVLAVETSGCGYLPDRRPQILFERHIFHRLTNGQYDDGDISSPRPGGYGKLGAHQYDRLAVAISEDRNAALQSASWGIGQIMGMNYALAGFQSVDDMVVAMSASEDQQLAAVVSFLVGKKLDGPLQAHDWQSFALGYNGPNYKVNHYDTKLVAAFQRYSADGLPDLSVRAAQLYLTYLGYKPGRIDGVVGPLTLPALSAFQSDHGLAANNTIDAACVAQISGVLQNADHGSSGA